jgi:hypothetical protein
VADSLYSALGGPAHDGHSLKLLGQIEEVSQVVVGRKSGCHLRLGRPKPLNEGCTLPTAHSLLRLATQNAQVDLESGTEARWQGYRRIQSIAD